MSTPAMRALKQGGARLTLLGSRSGAAVARHVPLIDDTIVYDAPWVKGPEHGSAADLELIATLRDRAFDAAVIFTVCTQSALPAAMACRLAGIPLRLAHCRENPYGLLTDWVHDREVCEDGMRHEVRRQLDLVRSVGLHTPDERLAFECLPDDVTRMQRKLAAAGGDPARSYVVIHPGATAASRRYPPERFGQAADILQRETGCQVVFTGGPDERELVARARQAMQAHTGAPVVSLAGALSLGELAALLAGAHTTVCNNSGPAHLCAALGTPVVVLYALTNPQHTPWQVRSRVLNHEVPCRNCLKSICPQGHHACLLEVQAPAVARAALELMGIDAPPHRTVPLVPRAAIGALPLSA
ncbi:glycosyltransferase family 9 protein [Piscinibacter sp. HJYY11]|nr:glycosyltransferase family 9 protein [Piscinibacter sp. HJYY11]